MQKDVLRFVYTICKENIYVIFFVNIDQPRIVPVFGENDATYKKKMAK